MGLVFVVACTNTVATPLSSTRDAASRERAPAVVLDLQAPLPGAAAHAQTGSGVVVLSAPRDRAIARETVQRFFQAVLAEDLDGLQPLLAPGAQVSSDARGTRWQALTFWRLRFNRLDYGGLGGRIVVRDDAVQTYTADDLAVLEPFRKTSLQLEPSQILVRAPIETTTVDNQTLFGDEIAFVLAPVDEGYTIVHLVEPFSLP